MHGMESDLGTELESLIGDPQNLGALLGQGAQHAVYRLKERVLKLPHDQVPGFSRTVRGALHNLFIAPLVRQTPETAMRNADWAKEYFESYMAPSEVIAGVRRGTYYILQDYVPFTNLTPELARSDASYGSQLRDIMHRGRDLMRERGHLLDVMGFNPKALVELFRTGRGVSDNVVIGPDRRLTIIDDGMFALPGRGGIPLHAHAVQYVQEKNIRSFLGAPEEGMRGWYYLNANGK